MKLTGAQKLQIQMLKEDFDSNRAIKWVNEWSISPRSSDWVYCSGMASNGVVVYDYEHGSLRPYSSARSALGITHGRASEILSRVNSCSSLHDPEKSCLSFVEDNELYCLFLSDSVGSEFTYFAVDDEIFRIAGGCIEVIEGSHKSSILSLIKKLYVVLSKLKTSSISIIHEGLRNVNQWNIIGESDSAESYHDENMFELTFKSHGAINSAIFNDGSEVIKTLSGRNEVHQCSNVVKYGDKEVIALHDALLEICDYINDSHGDSNVKLVSLWI